MNKKMNKHTFLWKEYLKMKKQSKQILKFKEINNKK